jgi:hypothetical protein
VAPVSSTRPQKEDLHLQLKSRAGQKPWQRTASRPLNGNLEKLQTSHRRTPREKTGGASEDARKQVALTEVPHVEPKEYALKVERTEIEVSNRQ